MAFSAEQLNIIVSARTQDLEKQLSRAERNVRRFESQSKRSLSQTSRSFDMLGTAARRLAPILAATFSVQAVRGAAQQAKEIQNLSNIAGVTAVEFQKLAAASGTVGISQEKFADIIKDVNDKFGDFMATGAGPMADFFENIAPLVGVTAEQFAKLSGPEALQLYVSSLEAAGVSQQQMTFYMEALASDATALVPLLANNGTEMRRLGDEAERSGRILGDDAVAAGARLDKKMNELSTTLTTKLQQAILDNAGEIEDFADKAIPLMVGGLTAIGETAVSVASHISGLVAEISSLAAEAQGFYDSIAEWAKTSGLTIDRFFPDGDIPDWLRTMRGEVPANDAPLTYGPQNGRGGRTGGRVIELEDIVTPAPTPGKSVPLVSPGSGASRGGGGGGGGTERDPLADLMKRIVLEQELLGASEARRQVLEAIAGSDKKYTDDAIDGAVSRIEAYELEKKAMERIQAEQQAIADTLQSSMESAFMSIVDGTKTAEDAFRDMAKQIILELYRVLVVQRLVGSFNATTGEGSGIVGTIAKAITGRASGGSVQAGRPYMTGESGRELFVPSTNGRILSPAQTNNAMMSSGGVVVNQTINVSTGVQQTVRSEIKSLMPQIAESAKGAVLDAKRRGGSYGRAFA
jgi:hypothetical protein